MCRTQFCDMSPRLKGKMVYKCGLCNTPFGPLQHLKDHVKIVHAEYMRTHVKPVVFQCGVCNKRFDEAWYLSTHVNAHMGIKDHECVECLERFSSRAQLTYHTRSVHTGERPFRCEVCDKGYITKSDLNRHAHIHAGDRSFKCDDCGKSFTAKSTLAVHKNIHTGEKQFQCEVCGGTFTSKSALKYHRSIHAGEWLFSCEDCPKRVRSKQHLAVHRDKHHA